MPYDWKIELDGVDITDKVARFDIATDLAQYCRELTVDIADPAYYAMFDFSMIPSAPALEVFTKTGDTWVSQGRYFVERPAISSDIHQDVITGLWGRGETARLGAPFAPRVSKMWTADTSFFAICAEMCALSGLTWDDSQSSIEDFYVFAYTFQVENAYPIDVIAELCELAGAIATADRLGRVRILARDYAPAAAVVTITDDDWASISETPVWPDFGNRVRIIPTDNLAGYSLAMTVPCLPADGASRARVYARVTDADGNPLDGQVVTWSLAGSLSAALIYTATNTGTTIMPAEEVRAQSHYQLGLAVPPAAILGVYAYADRARKTDLALAGYTIDGTTVTLAEPLKYCDQLVRVIYTAAGMAVNFVQAGLSAEDIEVAAAVSGQSAAAAIYIGNGCRCPASLRLAAVPASIVTGETAKLIVYAEEGGGPISDGRLVRLAERTALGVLSWTTARLGQVAVSNERTSAVNEIAGASQCQLERFPVDGTVRIYRAGLEGAPTGANLYAGHNGKTVDLATPLETGTELVAHYTARGAALAHFAGTLAGTAYFRASMPTNREAPLEAEASLRITDPTDPTSGDTGEDYTPGGYGGVGGDDGGLDTSWQAGGCLLDDGSVVQCEDDPGDDWAQSKTCCEKNGVPGCWPRSACDDSQPQFNCIPANISDNPDATAVDRFGASAEVGCTCEEMCRAELAAYGTTQGYDGGSYRTVEEIVADQGLAYEEGGDNAAYNEAYGQVEGAALADCIAACETLAFSCADTNPETIGYRQTVSIAVTGGRPPFAWSVSGDFTLGAAETQGRANTLGAEEGACGSVGVTVTDADGKTVVCTLRHTDGKWKALPVSPDCIISGPPSGDDHTVLIEGRYRVDESKIMRYRCSLGGEWIDNCTCNNCAATLTPCIKDGNEICPNGGQYCPNGLDCYKEEEIGGYSTRTVHCLDYAWRIQSEWVC